MKAWNSTLSAGKPMQRGAWKKHAPKKRASHDRKVRNACKGQRCYLCIPGVCLGSRGFDTVVPCHSNQQIHGKGMGLKAADKFTVPGCMTCHAWLDRGSAPKAVKFEAFNRAYAAWAPARDAANSDRARMAA